MEVQILSSAPFDSAARGLAHGSIFLQEAFVALPAVFLRDEHILVNLFDNALPRLVPHLKRANAILAAIVLGVIAWQGFLAAADSFAFNDVTADLGLPRVWHWSALLIGVVASAVAASAMAWWGSDGP